MAVTPTIQNVQPTVGGSADTWGGTVNSRLQETYADINALATQGNATETTANGAVQTSGSTSTGDQILADVAPTSTFSAGYRGLPTLSFDADRTLLATDSGKMLRLNGTTARTWTIPPNAMPVGTVIILRNYSTQNLSVARGAGVTLQVEGGFVNANYTIASGGKAAIIQEDANIWTIGGIGVS